MRYLGAIAIITGIVIVVLIVGAVLQAPPDWTKYNEMEGEDDKNDG